MEVLGEFLTNNSGLIITLLLTLCLTFFSKVCIGIFKLGVEFKSDLVNKDEFEKFKRETRAEVRAYKTELTEVLLQTSVKIIDERLKDIKDTKEAINDVRILEATMREQFKNFEEKFSEVRQTANSISALNGRVESLSTQIGTPTTVRRKDGVL